MPAFFKKYLALALCYAGSQPHPREFRFWGVMKHEVLGVFWVHMAHDWSVYWKILTFAGKNLEISNIGVIYVLKTQNLQQFWYVWCHFFSSEIQLLMSWLCYTSFLTKNKSYFAILSSKTVNLGFCQFTKNFVADCQALSISQSLNLSLSLRDRDRADTIITLYFTQGRFI